MEIRDLPFYEQSVYKAIAYLYEKSLGRETPIQMLSPVSSLGLWCPEPPHKHVVSVDVQSVVSLRGAADVGIVIMTAVQFEYGRIQYINQTWARHFTKLVYASGDGPSSPLEPLIHRVAAPQEFLQYFSPDSYLSHIYKGHVGLSHFFSRHPTLPWYALVSDDSYLYAPFLLEFLISVSTAPALEAVCAGHLQRQPIDVHWRVIKRMFQRCDQIGHSAGFGLEWASLCKEKASMLRIPSVGITYPHGAGIFCSHAAMVLLQPYLETVLAARA